MVPCKSTPMIGDPWSRPSLDDLKAILESIDKTPRHNERSTERLELSVPAEIVTQRGNIVPAMTREISRQGIGLLHRGSISPGVVIVRMASETREFSYRVRLEWCYPAENGMFLSGGQFVENVSE